MDEEKSLFYDPNPLDMELEIYSNLKNSPLELSDLAKPEIVQFLFHNQKVAVSKLKIAEKQISNLSATNSELIETRETLRIEVARKQEWEKATWLEIPISILSGFSINMLTSNIGNGIGWLLLFISLTMLFILRGTSLMKKSTNKSNEDIKNG